jgi:hypothetical protein
MNTILVLVFLDREIPLTFSASIFLDRETTVCVQLDQNVWFAFEIRIVKQQTIMFCMKTETYIYQFGDRWQAIIKWERGDTRMIHWWTCRNLVWCSSTDWMWNVYMFIETDSINNIKSIQHQTRATLTAHGWREPSFASGYVCELNTCDIAGHCSHHVQMMYKFMSALLDEGVPRLVCSAFRRCLSYQHMSHNACNPVLVSWLVLPGQESASTEAIVLVCHLEYVAFVVQP